MLRLFKKAVLSLLSTSVLAVSLAIPVSASAAPSTQYTTAGPNFEVGTQQVEPYGWKTKITKEGVELAASYIRNGGYALEKAISKLSPTAARAFGRWADNIADFLDDLCKGWDEAEEYAISYVKDQVRNFLRENTKLSPGTIEEIVVAVDWLLWFVA